MWSTKSQKHGLCFGFSELVAECMAHFFMGLVIGFPHSCQSGTIALCDTIQVLLALIPVPAPGSKTKKGGNELLYSSGVDRILFMFVRLVPEAIFPLSLDIITYEATTSLDEHHD